MLRRIGTVMTMAGMAILASPLLAMAQQAAGAAGSGAPLRDGLIAIAANIGIGIAAFGSALAQGRMAASAMESIGRNPNSAGQIFVPMIIGLAFIEALTLRARDRILPAGEDLAITDSDNVNVVVTAGPERAPFLFLLAIRGAWRPAECRTARGFFHASTTRTSLRRRRRQGGRS